MRRCFSSTVTRLASRSEEGRVGEEGRSRWSPYHLKKKKETKKGCVLKKKEVHKFERSASAAAGTIALLTALAERAATATTAEAPTPPTARQVRYHALA